MKKITLLAAWLLSIGCSHAQNSVPTNIMTLNGTYDLFENSTGTISKFPDQSMTIMTFDHNKFVVQGVSPGDAYWVGLGELNGNEGFFDYRFQDGRFGQTTFRIDKNGNLDARSLSFTVDYKYLAKKRPNP
ncbi:MAG: hypothetical protein ACO29U_08905 [Crocinitomicaceae bacterium]